MASSPDHAHPVVVVGAGPAGLVAAATLARRGVGVVLVERNPGLSPLPRATGVGVRTMELLRSWGLEGEVRAGQLDVAAGALATETLASPAGVEVPLGFATHAQVAAASPTSVAAVPQDHLEPVLLRHLRDLPAAEVRFGTELVGFDQDADGVTVVLADRATGTERRLEAAYLVGADGAHSRVRARLGVAMDGPDHLAEHVTALVEAPLGELVGDRRYGIYHIRHPEAAGVLVPNGSRHRWLYGRAWDPRRERLADYTDERLAGLVRTAAGADLPVRVIAKGAFSFAAQVAERYRSGRAFLVGDAAQRMTPRGGMGMNTAVAEAHDLGWKLAWVVAGWSGPALLDSYEAEWRPVGTRRARRSAQDGPEPDGAEALAEDLRGRLPHAWLDPARTRSTLDLLGPGLTLLAGPHARPWTGAVAAARPAFPLDVHPLDPGVASTLAVAPDGAILARPDAQPVAHWPTAPSDPPADLAAQLGSPWFDRPVGVRTATGATAGR